MTDPTRPDPRPWLSSGRIPCLDGLRALAILLVLLAHAHQTAGFPAIGWLRQIGERGQIGVEVFFVISGFLITTLMLREIDRTRTLSIRGFYVRRILRIIPAYACLLGAVAVLAATGRTHMTGRDWLASLTYTVNFLHHPNWDIGHAWSLSIEEHYYLLWPLVMALGGVAIARGAAVGIIVGCFILRWVVLLAAPRYTSMAELWTFTRLDSIAFGSLLAILARQPSGRSALDRLCRRKGFLWLTFATLLFSLWMTPKSGKFAVGLAFTINGAAITILTWAAINGSGLIPRLLNHRILAAIGVGSYSLYLWQQIFLDRQQSAFAYRFPQNLILAALAAFLSYRLVERPFLSLKERLGAPRRGHLPVPTAAGEPVPLSSPGPAAPTCVT